MAIYAGFEGKNTPKSLQDYLDNYVIEVVFVRRRRAKDPSVTTKTRRMICTTCQPFLNSPFGKKTLRYKPARFAPPYNAKAKGLVTAWDIFMQDWRNIDVKSAVIVGKKNEDSLPMYVASQEGMAQFALFYTAKLSRMNRRQFMDS